MSTKIDLVRKPAGANSSGEVTDQAQTFAGDKTFENYLGIGVAPTTNLHIDSKSNFNFATFERSTTHPGLSWTAGISDLGGGGSDLLFRGSGANTGFGFQTSNATNTLLTALVLDPSGACTLGPSGFTGEHSVNGRAALTGDDGSNHQVTIHRKNAGAGEYAGLTFSARGDGLPPTGDRRFGIFYQGNFGYIAFDNGSDVDADPLTQNGLMSFNGSNGRVGIGVTSPGADLHVDNDSAIGSGYFVLNVTTGNNGTTLFRVRGDGVTQVRSAAWATGGTAVGINGSDQLTKSPSSLRYKTNVVDLDTEIDSSAIYNLRPVTFDYINDGSHSFGYIAEEVDQTVPCLVYKTPDENGDLVPESVSYAHLSVLLVEELKKLRDKNDELQARLDAAGL